MTHEERMSRAGDYVLGLMDDHDRRRAERDLEVDAEFRACVVSLAERFRLFHSGETRDAGRDDMWASVEARLAALPQMTGSHQPGKPGNAAEAGRQGEHAPSERRVRGRRIAIAAASLAAAASLGYCAGRAQAPLDPAGLSLPDAIGGDANRANEIARNQDSKGSVSFSESVTGVSR